jgi:hypothetical protein
MRSRGTDTQSPRNKAKENGSDLPHVALTLGIARSKWCILMINVAESFDAVIRELGGEIVSDLVGMSPPFENADYVLREYGAVSEDAGYADANQRPARQFHRLHATVGRPKVFLRVDLLRPNCAASALPKGSGMRT